MNITTINTTLFDRLQNTDVNNLVATLINENESDLPYLALQLKNAGNLARYILAGVIKHKEEVEGKDSSIKFVETVLDMRYNSIYPWLRSYEDLKNRSDDVVRAYLFSTRSGIVLQHHVSSLSKQLQKEKGIGLTDEQVIDIINHVDQEQLTVIEAKGYINDRYKHVVENKPLYKNMKIRLSEEDYDTFIDYLSIVSDNSTIESDDYNLGKSLIRIIEENNSYRNMIK